MPELMTPLQECGIINDLECWVDADMPLNETDKGWIRNEIKESLKKGGIVQALKDWGAIGILVAIALFALVEWSKYTEFRVHTEDKLASIDSILLGLRAASSPKAVLNEASKLGTKGFEKALYAIRQVATQAPASVNASTAVLSEVAHKLNKADASAPDYWPTTLQYIQFATSSVTTLPVGKTYMSLSNVSGLGNINGINVLLDHGAIENVRFSRCRIRFTEQPIHFKNVMFTDCIFEMPILQNPSEELKQASRLVLASDLQTVYVPNLG